MQRVSSSALLNLFAATEAVGDDEPIGGRVPYCRQQFKFANRDRNRILFFFKSEGSSHSATSGRRHFVIHPEPPQNRFLICHLQGRLLMAMPVD